MANPGGWVLEVEGEKAAEIAREGGLVAISQPGHAHTVEQIKARYSALGAAGVVGVIYLADQDITGLRRAQVALEAAAAVGLQLVVLPASEVWQTLPDGGSIDDASGTPTERVAAIEETLALIEPSEWAGIWAEFQEAMGVSAPVQEVVAQVNVFPDIEESPVVDGATAGQVVATAPIPLTESQRFELLRGRARQVLEEHPRKVEQELAMRLAAHALELPALGQQQIRTLLWEARNGDAGPVQPLTANQPLSLAPTPWLLEGIVMAGALNLIVALPKIGKTAWALGFLGAWIHGLQTFLGCSLPATPCPPVLIVGTDQPENDWGRMLAQFGLLDHNRRMNPQIVGLFTAGRPLHLDAEGIDRITTYAEKHPGLVVLIDSLHACISPLGLKEESAEVAEPVRDLMSALEPHRATVLLIHHANKGRANDGAVAASRGSTALPAVASQMISLNRLQTGAGGPQGNKERRLVLKTEGRGGMPQELLIERTDAEGWICHGDAAAAMEAQAREQARENLTDRQQSALRLLIQRAKAGESTTVADAVTALDLSRQRAQDTLGALVQKRLAIKTIPTEPAPDGGRPAATYIPVPDA
ncbi:AAA family ATPase [Cyanobium gracile UHCC 0139]|uniref:AAA family ATPase n=1 Tax=Cyanobium gracile UHCC 0139 TaxID=3110308 RepID=A0ABU5RTT0_9CYAN|nr:AAA family ATPase [Cyanobium gracile]MEA5391151.1 AAA family ATPase [Cyanobium gracile UHCC 0139]